MKTPLYLLSGFVALGAFGLAIVPGAAGRNLQMIVVAEQTDQKTAPDLPKPDHPAFYVAFDAGYIEAGDPIANEKPPASSAMAEALRNTLAARGYQPAATGQPQILFVYHWGLLNRDSHAIRNGNTIDPNLHARLALLTTTKQDRDIESQLLDRRLLGRTNRELGMPTFVNFHYREIMELTHDDSYFVVLSAYDCASVSRQEARLLWQVKMSTRSAGVAMADALPTLLQGGAAYFGRDLDGFRNITAPLIAGNQTESGTAGAQDFSPPSGVAGPLDQSYLRELMKRAHAEFSGAHAGDLVAYAPRLAPPNL
jgi:hypothetical protein